MMKTISQRFFEMAAAHPHKMAIIRGDAWVTYAGLERMVCQQLAAFGDDTSLSTHLAVTLEDDIAFIALMIAAAYAGLVLVPLNPAISDEALDKVLKATDTELSIWAPISETTVPIYPIFPSGQTEDPYLLITTSGSTGDPKPIMLTQGTKLRRVEALIDLYGISQSDITLISTPLYHSMGQRLILASLLTGGTLVLMQDGWSVEKWLTLVEVHAVTFAIPVAAQVKQIADPALLRQYTMSSLRCLVSSSATLNPTTMKQLQEALPAAQIHNCYGTTEIAIATSGSNPESVGRAAPGVELVVTGEGEILVNTPLLFDGYYNQPEQTVEAMAYVDDIDGHGSLPARGGAFFKTGDLGRINGRGQLVYLGRIKELINVGGTKVYPQDVEEVLMRHPNIVECAAFPVLDDALGEVVGVAFVPRFSGKILMLRDIQKFCLPYLTDAQLPRSTSQRNALPKTDSGKIQRMKLAEKFNAQT